MDYIYKTTSGVKCVGQIKEIEIEPYYQFSIEVNKKIIWCHMDHLLPEWCIHFVSIDEHVELAHPTDVRWNTEALDDVFHNAEVSNRIAYGIKRLYEKCNYKGVSE